jgi:hypothetical protein
MMHTAIPAAPLTRELRTNGHERNVIACLSDSDIGAQTIIVNLTGVLRKNSAFPCVDFVWLFGRSLAPPALHGRSCVISGGRRQGPV